MPFLVPSNLPRLGIDVKNWTPKMAGGLNNIRCSAETLRRLAIPNNHQGVSNFHDVAASTIERLLRFTGSMKLYLLRCDV
jgi:hypothetical protein